MGSIYREIDLKEFMKNTLTSIIIPVFNYEEFITDCLKSCIEQTYENIEILVVDDCSTDNSLEAAYECASLDGRIKVQTLPENKGYSAAKNAGIRVSKGAFIVHLDADDMLLSDSVEARLKAFEPSIDMVHALAWRYREIDGVWQKDGYNKKASIHAQTIMIRRSVYERYGLYYEGLRSKADKEYWFRLGIHPKSPLPKLIKVKKIKEKVALYRKHPEQLHRIRNSIPKYRTKIEKIFKKRIKQLKEEGITKENTKFL